MIKTTIQNAPYCTEIEFPCTETELSKKLGDLGMNAEHLAPEGTVIAIEPAELSMLNDCLVSIDALNFLGKRMDGMDNLEKDRFFAALSCDESIGHRLKDIINLTYNLSHYTLIKDTADLERAGFVHMCNIRGALTAPEFENKAWLAEEGSKLINSGKGIDTEYGKIFVNEEIEFNEVYNGTVFPVFYSNLDAVVSVEVSYLGATELVDLPNEDVAIKKALTRLGADSIEDCTLKIDSFQDIADDWWEEIKDVEQSKDIFGLNSLLKTMNVCFKEEVAENVSEQQENNIQEIGSLSM